jgi:hypothetical protein
VGEACYTIPGGVIPARVVHDIASVAHEANARYCATLGDHSQEQWDAAPQWQKDSAIMGVLAIARGNVKNAGDSHRGWLAQKKADGWVYGDVKDTDAKTHPCMVAFERLPHDQQVKDHLFLAVVSTLLAQYHAGC